MDIHQIFPTPVGVFELGRRLTEEELDCLGKEPIKNNIGNLVGTNGKLLDNTKLFDLKKFIEHSISEYFKYVYCPATDVSVYITQSWFNVTKKGQSHHKHSHANSFLSGVFYVQTSDTDIIMFHKNKYEQLSIQPTNGGTGFNFDSWWMPAKPFTLLLFPSGLEHSVPEYQGELDRISISFNTFLKGDLGASSVYTGLTL
jgi:uncharacterized protein (TIGR02466 family)